MNTPAPSASKAERLAAILILALAIFLRLWPIGSGLPYIDYIDEGHVLHQSLRVLQEHTYDTRLYDYPSVPSYLISAAVVAYAPVYQVLRGRSFWDDLSKRAELDAPLGEVYDLISPPDFILVGRAVVAACSLGTVLLAGLLARRINGTRAALLAMLLVAICPALVSRGSIIIVDTVATFFTMTALCLAQRLQRSVASGEPSPWRHAASAGLAAGFAAAAKYPAGAVFAALLAAIAMLPLPFRKRIGLAVISASGFLFGSVVGMPALALKPMTILNTWRYLVSAYDDIVSRPGYFGTAISPHELGIPLLIAAGAGVALMLRNRGVARVTAISWLAFAGLLLGVITRASFQPFRNLTSLVPLVCIAAAFALVWIYDWLGRTTAPRLAIAAAILLLASSMLLPLWHDLSERKAHIDTRILAINWLRQHSGAQTRVLGLDELGILPSEWKRLGASSSVVRWADALVIADQQPFDYLVTGDLDLREAPELPKWTDYLARWNEKTAPLPIAAEFGTVPAFLIPNFWRTNDEHIVIRKTPAP